MLCYKEFYFFLNYSYIVTRTSCFVLITAGQQTVTVVGGSRYKREI